jgi:hypothetical protein
MISYDLRGPGQNYPDVSAYLEGHGTYWHALGSAWFIVTSKDTAQVRNELAAICDANDKIIVIDVSKDEAAWRGFRADESDWILKHITE